MPHEALLQKVKLFEGIPAGELARLLPCLGADRAAAPKDSFLLLAGETPRKIGVVLEGELHVLQEDVEGQRMILAVLRPGDFYAEALCCAGVEESPVSVAAAAASQVLLLDYRRLLAPCREACAFHRRLLENMLQILARKNLLLQGRLEVVGARSLRQKILRYLHAQGAQKGQPLTIPLDREGLADYLCVDRSALSHELSRMRREGLLTYRKNRFTLG